tara:strand:- start:2779 stop:3150 length:372 start_codon:yes stop_codon:yes gene_type:complete
MEILSSPQQYLFHLQTTSSGEAKRMWRKKIKDKWENKCAYCGCDEHLTIDHIVPRSKGGPDFTKNCLCACHTCNQDKGHTPWEEWYNSQEFFSMQRYEKIKEWIEPDPPTDLFRYRPRRNNAT